MREKELREAAECVLCKKGIGHTGLPLFWRVRIERYGLEVGALQRQSGLETFFGGHVALAQVMGADEEMAKKMSSKEITLCETCAMSQVVIAALAMEETDDEEEIEEETEE